MMGSGVESYRELNSEHARGCMESLRNNNPTCKVAVGGKKFQTLSQCQEKSVMGETDCEVVTENSVVISKTRSSAAASSKLGFKARSSLVVSKSSNHGDTNNSSSQCHVCRFCGKVFGSGKALGGHVRIHGAGRSKGQSSSNGNTSRVCDYSSTGLWVKKSKVPTTRSNGNSNWVRADSIEGEIAEEEDSKVVRDMKMDFGQEESSDRKMVSLYALRRHPKRSRRLTDEDFSIDLIANNSRACVQCGKEFPSSKALYGHMRCHREQDWRGTQPSSDNINSPDDDSQYNTTGGDIVVHASAAPSSGLSSVCWQSSQGSEDLEEKWDQEAAASDDESERMEGGKAAHQPASCSLLSWSVTAKRGRRRSIRSTQAQQEDDGVEEEVKNTKELENDRETAHFLVMLASSASNTIDTAKGNGDVERQMTDESAYHSKVRKHESQGTLEDLEVREKDLGRKEKIKKRSTDKTSSYLELGKYKCSTCKKLFKTHQALGGHRSSHRKVKSCSAIQEVTEEEIPEEGSSILMIEYHPAAVDDRNSREEEKRASLTYLTEEHSTEPAKQAKKGKRHECCICHRIFSSGQALGGHKRSHGTANRVTANNVPTTEKRPKLLLKGKVREPLFDLNQPAPVQEEDLEAAYDMVDVVPPFSKRVNHKVKMIEVVTINAGFRHVECNICGCLFTSMDSLRAHQIVHT